MDHELGVLVVPVKINWQVGRLVEWNNSRFLIWGPRVRSLWVTGLIDDYRTVYDS